MTWEEAVSVVDRPPVKTNNVGFWRQDTPIIHEGILSLGGMYPAQQQFWNLDTFVKAFVGGYGAGKTNIGCKRIISLGLQNAPVPVASVSPTFPLARTTTIATLQEMLEGKRRVLGRDFWWRYNKTSHEFTYRHHGRTATIIVYSGDDPERLKGPNLGAAHVDEPFIQDYAVFQQMIARIRHPQAQHKELILTGTPEELNWGYDLLEGDLSRDKDLTVGFVNASTRQNLILGQDYVKRLEATLSAKAAKAYIDGQFVNLSDGLVYYGFDPSTNIHDYNIPDGAELGMGLDFNVNPMSCVIFWRLGNHVHVFAEHELPNADTEYLAQVMKEEYGDRLTMVFPHASGSARRTSAPGGKSDFSYLKAAGFEVHANASNPRRKDRYNAVNGKLKTRDGSASLTISPRCTKLKKYLSTYSHALMKKQEHMSHLLDAFSYPIAYLFPVDKETLTALRLSGT